MINCPKCETEMKLDMQVYRKIAVVYCPECGFNFERHISSPTIPGLIGPENGKPIVGLRG